MKRSGQVGLAVMGVAAFAATYASVSAFRAPATAAHTCTTRSDGTQTCEPTRRSFTYYLYPHFGSSSASASPAKPTQSVALTSNARGYTSASPSGTARGGFGTTAARGSFRVSAGG